MKRLLLTSEFAQSGDYLKKVLPSKEQKMSVAYIANAADMDDDKSWMNVNRDKFKELGYHIIDIDLREVQHQELSEMIHELVDTEEILYIGTSAGSIIAGPNIESTKFIDEPEDAPELQNYTSFDLVNFVTVPHVGTGDFYYEYEKGYFELFHNLKHSPYPHICLKDNQAVWVEGNSFKIITL